MSKGRILKYHIRQVVPAAWCFSCDVCCRFPEKDSFLAPYFTKDEIASAIEGDISASHFPRKNGGKITLIPYREGYLCPAFDPTTAHCKIYNCRPVDCMLYPFAIMRDIHGKEVVLGIDRKCPYVREHVEDRSLKDTSIEIAAVIESPPLLEIFALNKGLIGPYQDDVLSLLALKRLTSKI